MFFERPLDQGLCDVFTDARSGQRTPTGAVRRGLRPSPHRRRGAAETRIGQCSRPPRTGLSGSFGSAAATTSRPPSRETGTGVGSNRACDDLRVVAGDGDLLERAEGTSSLVTDGRCGEAIGSEPPSGVRGQRSSGVEPEELGPPQLDPARSVPIGARTEGSGNRVSVKRCQRVRNRATGIAPDNAASPAPPFGETGDVNRSSRRLTPDVRSVVDLSTRRPGRCAGASQQHRPGRFRFPSPVLSAERGPGV